MQIVPVVLRCALAVGLLVGGLVVGIAAAAVHPTWWGLPLALVTTAVTTYALPSGWARRMPFVLGWAVAVGVLSVPRAEGDYVIAGDLNGYALLVFGLAMGVATVATLPPPRANARSRASTS